MPTETLTAPRLIDANALIEMLEKMKIPVTGLGFTLVSQHNQSIRDAIYAVNSLPTVETTDDVMKRLPNGGTLFKSHDGKTFEAFLYSGVGKGATAIIAIENLNDMLNSKRFLDGNMWCATRFDFVNLAESPAGFGKSQCEAFLDLRKNELEAVKKLEASLNPK